MFKIYHYTNVNFNKTFEICIAGMYIGITFALQVILAFIPNVELVTFLISFAGLVFSFITAFTITIGFCLLEGIFFGFAQWTLLYFVAFPLLVTITFLLRRVIAKKSFIFILVNTLFGFLFGAFDAFVIKYLFFGRNIKFSITYWFAGIVFDIIHGVSNFWVSFILFKKFEENWKLIFERYYNKN